MEDYTIHSADKKVLEYLPELTRQSEKERQDKIRLLYSHGFILTPFEKAFINPFHKRSIKYGMLTLNYKEIENYLDLNFNTKDDDVENLVEQLKIKSYKWGKIRMLLSGASLTYGIFFFVISIILYFLFRQNAKTIVIITMLSSCLIYYWVAYQTSMEDQSRTATLYIEKGGLLQFLTAVSIITTLVLIYFSYHSPLIYFAYIFYAILFGYFNVIITRNLKNEWWSINGFHTIKEYYIKTNYVQDSKLELRTDQIKSTSIEITNDKINLKEVMSTGIDFLTLIISRDEITRNDISISNNILQQLTTDKKIVNHFRERIEITFDGYNNTTEEIWEIPQVRKFVEKLDSEFPYWLYFLTKNGNGLYAIIKCFLIPNLIPEADIEINDLMLKNYLDNRGFPAMNHICNIAGISENENIQMTDRLFEYVQQKQL
ncbi:chlororespiratory reduction 6 domain-containing protein [Pedobacter nyackensis]|uniref:Uncharacterized protein n=1 Tax=Pedobacter nyackensis TaxID=475255 RepID=A0A1W2DUQ8_9SPHI|nr:chlororespiratory reduction 6 domain-containing protein [Pedobacter nyackensis]SMD01275.1 hypothetical protein SAMN04488101_108158 [Pedobacter nyackensis]